MKMKKLDEKQKFVLETVGYLQLFVLSFCNEEPDIKFFFKSNGTTVYNPMRDETYRNEVDPIKHYGEKFLNSDFMKLI